MKFEDAMLTAMENETIVKAFLLVAEGVKNGEATAAYTFAIGDEAFTFGYDGCELHKVKHTKKRSQYLISSGQAIIIGKEETNEGHD